MSRCVAGEQNLVGLDFLGPSKRLQVFGGELGFSSRLGDVIVEQYRASRGHVSDGRFEFAQLVFLARPRVLRIVVKGVEIGKPDWGLVLGQPRNRIRFNKSRERF
jgi:hypothetical protein